MPSHSADRPPAQIAAATAALGDELAASVPVLQCLSAPGNGDDLTAEAPGVRGAYTYGYDSAGNPTFADPGYACSSDRNLPSVS